MKLRRKKRFEAEVATSSLNDIMFFLLLFFLIISTIANPNVIKVLLPKADKSQTLNKKQYEKPEELIADFEQLRGQVVMEGIMPNGSRMVFSTYVY